MDSDGRILKLPRLLQHEQTHCIALGTHLRTKDPLLGHILGSGH